MPIHKDHVCGMQVEEAEAAGQSEHEGETYYVCSTSCKDKFDQSPDDYTSNKTESAGNSCPALFSYLSGLRIAVALSIKAGLKMKDMKHTRNMRSMYVNLAIMAILSFI